MTHVRWSAVDVLWWGLGVLLIAALALPPRTAGDSLGWRRFTTPEVSAAWRMEQAFTMDAANLSAIELRPLAVGPAHGRVRLRLSDRSGETQRSAEVMAADVVARDTYRFEFAPVGHSAGRPFRLLITSADGSPTGVAFWATKGERLEPPDGLLINDVPRWGSLAFRTQTPAVSLLRGAFRGDGAGRLRRWLAIGGLIGAWIALRFVLVSIDRTNDDVLLAR